MEITDVRIRRVKSEGRMKAIGAITFDNEFVVRGLRVIEVEVDGEKKRFTAMPSERGRDGTFRDVAHPINSAMRAKVQAAVLEAYEQAEDPDEQTDNMNFETEKANEE